MTVKEKDKRLIFTMSYNGCSFYECEQKIAKRSSPSKYVNIGDICHIKGENRGSARYDPNQPENERNSLCNLIILCKNHHKMVDDDTDTYTIKKLHEMKDLHIKQSEEKISSGVNNVTFVELEIIKKFLNSKSVTESNMSITNLKDKIKKNEISRKNESLIKVGLSRVDLVNDYINTNLDINFGERLKSGFVEKYKKEKNNLSGDELFTSLLEYANGGSSEIREISAGLIVLSYFFEKCDVFEK